MRRFGSRTVASWLALSISGCYGWRTEQVAPTTILARPNLSVVRVSTHDSSGIVLFAPRVINDSVVGHPTEAAIQKRSVALKDITAIATRHRHIAKTLLAGIVIVGGVLLYSALQSNQF